MNKTPYPILYCALGDILKERGETQAEARRKYGFDKKSSPLYISRTGFLKLCNRPKQAKFEETLSILCYAMDLEIDELIRKR